MRTKKTLIPVSQLGWLGGDLVEEDGDELQLDLPTEDNQLSRDIGPGRGCDDVKPAMIPDEALFTADIGGRIEDSWNKMPGDAVLMADEHVMSSPDKRSQPKMTGSCRPTCMTSL